MLKKETISIKKSTSNKGAIKKSTHQYCETTIPPALNEKLVIKHPLPAKSQINKIKGNYIKENLNKKLHVPIINSSALAAKLDQLKIEDFSPNVLTPKSKTSFAQEVTKKLNVPSDVTIFKNLISLNVNDSILIPEYGDKNFKPNKYRLPVGKDKDPIPNLKDFLRPIEPMELKTELENYKRPNVLRKPNNDNFELIRELITRNHPAW